MVFITAAARLHALTIDNYTAAANDRFANNPAFIAGAFNLSGVSRASNGAWVTMLAPNVFVAANHYTPAEGNTVIFYATNNSSGPSVTRTVSGARQRVGTTDIFLGTLDRPLPEGYATYTMAAEAVKNSTGWTNTYRSAVLYHFGLSPGSYSGVLDIAVGRNVPDRWAGQHTIGPSTTWAFATTYDTSGAPNYQAHETQVVANDSGAPIFFDSGDGTLRLLGLTWGNGTWSANGTNYPISVFTYLGNYQSEIDAFLSTHSAPYLRTRTIAARTSAWGVFSPPMGHRDIFGCHNHCKHSAASVASILTRLILKFAFGNHE